MNTDFRVQPFMPLRPSYGGLLLPIYQAAVNEGIYKTQAPYKLVHHSALVAIVLSVQGMVDVEKPTGGMAPVSIMSLIAALSGERKSTVDAIYLSAIRKFDDKQRRALVVAKEVFCADRDAWKIEHSELERTLRHAIRAGDGVVKAKTVLRDHRRLEPQFPKLTRVLYQYSTLPALLKGLSDSPCAGLVSDEGKGVLVGDIFNERSKLNAFWSGSPVTVDRVTSESYVLKDVRLTTGLMVQPKVIEWFVSEKGEAARDSGLLARMIVCVPGSTQGGRFVGNAVDSDECCVAFANRVTALLEKYAADSAEPDFKRQTIRFSPMAATAWLRYFDEVEGQIQAGGRYARASDHASKLADNVARVAAALHYFEGFEGDISVETFQAAHMLVDDASYDFMTLFVPGPPGESEATVLDRWFTDNVRVYGRTRIAKSLILNRIPNALRGKAILAPVLETLDQMGRIRIEKQNGTCFIDLSPSPKPSNL